MSKKHQNQNCVYCVDKKAEDDDHIIARQFIPIDKRAYLPKVPSCKNCNNIKSKLEIYLTAILPFGSNAPSAKEMLKTMVPPRLENNFKLKKSLHSGARNVWVKSSDSEIIQRSMTLPIEGEKLIELLRMIIRGLSFHHWKVVIPKNYRVDVYALPLDGLIHFRDKIEPNFFKENSVEGNIGDGCFQYIGARHAALSTLSCWEISFYNVNLTGHGQKISGPLYFCGTICPAEPVSMKDLSLQNI